MCNFKYLPNWKCNFCTVWIESNREHMLTYCLLVNNIGWYMQTNGKNYYYWKRSILQCLKNSVISVFICHVLVKYFRISVEFNVKIPKHRRFQLVTFIKKNQYKYRFVHISVLVFFFFFLRKLMLNIIWKNMKIFCLFIKQCENLKN